MAGEDDPHAVRGRPCRPGASRWHWTASARSWPRRCAKATSTLAQAQVIRRAITALPASVDADVRRAGGGAPRRPGGRVRPEGARPARAPHPPRRRTGDRRGGRGAPAGRARGERRRAGPGSRCAASATAPPVSPDASRTRPRPGSRPTSRPTRTPASADCDDERQPDDPFTRLPYPRRLGEAFCAFLESLDPTRLPVHGGDATTVIVTIPLDSLRAELARRAWSEPDSSQETSSPATSSPQPRPDDSPAPHTSSPPSSAATASRSTSDAARRLFAPGQRKALLIRDQTCRAEGCDVPGTWCDAHHLDPWSRGGKTDLADGVLLCNHHHHRAHDTGYRHDRLPNGDLRFHRRT